MSHQEPDTPSPFTLYAPRGRLADYVRAIWTLDVPREHAAGIEQPVVPDGCPELVFNIGDPIHRARGTARDIHVEPQLAGQLTAPVVLRPQGRLAIVGIRLHPWAMQAFLGIGAREMRDSIIPARDALGGPLGHAIADLEHGAPRDLAAVMERTLTRYVRNRAAPNASAIMVHRALMHASRGGPTATVRSVARSLGRSERQLQRVFEESVGLSPKTYLRLTRIQRALRIAEAEPSRSWSDISGMCEFSDQSHLIREMQRFAGCSPTQFDERAGILTRSLVSSPTDDPHCS